MIDVFSISRGQIYWCDFGKSDFGIQGGVRPALIVSNNIYNNLSSNVAVVPITSVCKKLDYPSHVLINMINKSSVILCEQIVTVNKDRLSSFIGTLSDDKMYEVEKSSLIQLGILDSCDDSDVESDHISEEELFKTKLDSNLESTETSHLDSVLKANTGNTRRKWTDEDKISFLIDYNSTSRGELSMQELMDKWNVSTESYCRTLYYRFRKQAGEC